MLTWIYWENVFFMGYSLRMNQHAGVNPDHMCHGEKMDYIQYPLRDGNHSVSRDMYYINTYYIPIRMEFPMMIGLPQSITHIRIYYTIYCIYI